MSTCRDCIWWHPHGAALRFGDCRRHAPQVGRDSDALAVWPSTRPTSWCGEHRHKGYALALEETRAAREGETGA